MKQVKLKDSIATKLLIIVFSSYLIITSIVTVSHMLLMYNIQKKNIIHDLKNIQQTFESGLAIDLWLMNQESLESHINGIQNMSAIIGVKIVNNEGSNIAVKGVVSQDNAVFEIELNVNMLGIKSTEVENDKNEFYGFNIFEQKFPIVYKLNGQNKILGTATIYSSSSVIFQKIKLAFIMLIIDALLKIITLAFVFMWFTNNLIRKPLSSLATSTSEVTLNNLDTFRIKINTKERNEIAILEESFNSMIGNLNESVKEQKHQEIELRRLRNYLSNIIDSMPSILIGVDSNEVITQWNLEAEKTTGLSKKETIGTPLSQAIPRLSSEIEHIRDSIKTRKKINKSKVPFVQKNKTIYEDITIYPLVANGVEGSVIRIDDVTKEYEREQQLNQSKKMDAIGQLAGGVAHDFNNMLAAIMGAAQLLQYSDYNLDENGISYIDMIMKSSQRAADLTAKLLAFGRKGKVTSTIIDIHKIIDDTVTIFERTIDKKITILSSKEAKICTVVGDNSALQNALLNLGINASHAMLNGGELLIKTRNILLNEHYCEISPFKIEPGEFIEIEVRDTGTGISPANLIKIFDPFFTTKESGKGTGLGLASVYGTIQDHHGVITVSSGLNKGTSFHILIPCSQNDVVLEDENKVVLSGSGQILMVDDEEIIRITGKHTLERMEYKVLLAKDGSEAVKVFKEKHSEIDLVIMDMIMPEMNGSEAFYKMKEIDENCKVIISSGFTKDENLNELKKAGLLGFIQKPFRDYELSKLIAKVMNNESK